MYCLDGLHSSSYFQVLQSFYQSFGDCTKSTNYNWYKIHFHVPQFVRSQARSRYLSLFSHSFNFTLWSAGLAKSTILLVVFIYFLLIIIRSGLLAEIRWSVSISNPRAVCVCHFPCLMLGCAYTICWYGQIEISFTSPCGSLYPPSRV